MKPPQGLYLYGSVGCGKTMLMDLFYDASTITKKQRIHFHEFMQSVHRSKLSSVSLLELSLTSYRTSSSAVLETNKIAIYSQNSFLYNFFPGIHKLKSRIPRQYNVRNTQAYDPIPPLAEAISSETWLLCFDEFQVSTSNCSYLIILFDVTGAPARICDFPVAIMGCIPCGFSQFYSSLNGCCITLIREVGTVTCYLTYTCKSQFWV